MTYLYLSAITVQRIVLEEPCPEGELND